jgi:hypothetical protein
MTFWLASRDIEKGPFLSSFGYNPEIPKVVLRALDVGTGAKNGKLSPRPLSVACPISTAGFWLQEGAWYSRVQAGTNSHWIRKLDMCFGRFLSEETRARPRSPSL